ncbi:hypothetical protein, partial [Leptospira gomenensis]|uniref:hypothetical protein n=1 Tax=Leptospira gomenensis TaxID=2484974 RepID=UPI00143868F5
KRNLANAYLTNRVGNPILPEFLNELRAGKFNVLVPNQGVVEINSKFLGAALSEAQIQEIGSYLKLPDAKAMISRQGIIGDLDEFLKDQDPAYMGELRDVALVSSYAELKSGIAQGGV